MGNPKRIDARLLQGRWIHSHEEDTEHEAVYRPASWTLPPARGRTGFELRADGTATRLGPGPTDRPAASPGRWRLDADRLLLEASESGAPDRELRIVSLAADRLVIRK
jgi:hypothetical protein